TLACFATFDEHVDQPAVGQREQQIVLRRPTALIDAHRLPPGGAAVIATGEADVVGPRPVREPGPYGVDAARQPWVRQNPRLVEELSPGIGRSHDHRCAPGGAAVPRGADHDHAARLAVWIQSQRAHVCCTVRSDRSPGVADQLVGATGALGEAWQHRPTPGGSAVAADGDGEPERAARGAPVLLPRGHQMPGTARIHTQGWLLRDVDELAVAVARGDRARLADDAWAQCAEGWWRRGRRRRPHGDAGDEEDQSRNDIEVRGKWARHASALLRLECAGHL